MSDSESKPEVSLKVYVTASDIDETSITEALFQEEDEFAEMFKIENLEGKSTRAVIQHHRDSNHDESGTNDKLFLVFDSADFEDRGVLLVSLDEYHGFDDAVRHPPVDAHHYILALNCSVEEWYTVRQEVPEEKTEATPIEWFALYNSVPKRDDFNKALLALNKGVQDVGVSEPDEDGDTDEPPKFYKAVRAGNRNLDQIISDHPSYAEKNGLDAVRFAVIDGDYKEKGALLVQVGPERDSFRCKGDVAGELLRWIFVNLTTWDEAKELAGGQ